MQLFVCITWRSGEARSLRVDGLARVCALVGHRRGRARDDAEGAVAALQVRKQDRWMDALRAELFLTGARDGLKAH